VVKRARMLVLAVGVLAACQPTASVLPSASPTGEGAAAPAAIQFTDIFVPQGAKVYVEKTMIFGTDPWYGQLALGASADANQTFEQYRQGMAGFGWQEIAVLRAPTSFLTYTKDARVLTVQIQGTTLRGSDITITVSPREQARGAPGGIGGGFGAPAPAGAGPGGTLRPAPVTRQ
jgi:hypothetical protein